MGKSGPAAILRNLIVPPDVFLLSPFILVELSRVLRYERVRPVHKLSDDEIDSFLLLLTQNAEMVDVLATDLDVVPHDPDDNPIVATAIVGAADVICTLDRHLHHVDVKRYCAKRRVDVLTDVELLSRLRAG
jgi:putative PIN family toxin of toxin-antitoxin system